MPAIAAFAAAYADPTAAARAWKAAGGKVVGYLCDNVPEELIIAAGFFALRVCGDPDAGAELVRTKVDRLYTPDVTSRPAFVDSLLQQLLSGAYDVLDYLVVPHNRDAIQAIYRQLKDARRADPGLRVPQMHYLDKAWAPGAASETYNAARIGDLRAALEGWAGSRIADDALVQTLAEADENRRLLAEVAGLRVSARLSGVEALQVIGTSMTMARAEHSRLLRELLAEDRPARAGPRLFVGGSPLDHTRVYAAIEAGGATVVAEDHCWGNRAFDLSGLGAGDPMAALAARFHSKPACSIVFPIADGRKACARRAAEASVDGAIFYVMAEDWTQNWETPGQISALEAAGVPCLRLSNQSYAGEGVEAAVRPFVEGLAARAPA